MEDVCKMTYGLGFFFFCFCFKRKVKEELCVVGARAEAGMDDRSDWEQGAGN